jgi:lipoprotein-anchoring transpeptidase ErfK/SrfK
VLNRLSRRKLLLGGVVSILTSSVAAARDGEGTKAFRAQQRSSSRPRKESPDFWEYWDEEEAEGEYYDPALLPPPESEYDYPIETVDLSKIDRVYHRQVVRYSGYEEPGTIVVDPKAHFLYYVFRDGLATRYGVGVGRDGFAWSGNAEIRMKRVWPRWVPPREMVERDKRARKWANGQPGGPDNPLGARALYLFADGKDTLYRIHGTTEPESIGKSVSSGCIRMLNEDVADLFEKVKIGTMVVVRAA